MRTPAATFEDVGYGDVSNLTRFARTFFVTLI